MRWHSFFIFFIFLAILLVTSFPLTDDEGDIEQLSGLTMGTSYRFQLVGIPAELSLELIAEEIKELLMDLDSGIFSTYAPGSELSQLNRHVVRLPFEASPELMEVLLLAQEISVLTNGAFDITVGPLVNLWGFGSSPEISQDNFPTGAAIEDALRHVGYNHLSIDADRSHLKKNSDIFVDLSGIAKGYAVDRVGKYFDSIGIENYFLEIGGELKMKGFKPENENWIPAIETPQDSAPEIYEVMNSRGKTMAVAGSGDYRNYFTQNGERFSHEIDPRTGRPVANDLAAAYVVDSSAARADALATAYMVLGLEDAIALAERTDQAAYFIYREESGEFADQQSKAFNDYLGF
jgi:thiamine biosynthesis lipoprotein